jgi:hypothetical protein
MLYSKKKGRKEEKPHTIKIYFFLKKGKKKKKKKRKAGLQSALPMGSSPGPWTGASRLPGVLLPGPSTTLPHLGSSWELAYVDKRGEGRVAGRGTAGTGRSQWQSGSRPSVVLSLWWSGGLHTDWTPPLSHSQN